LLYYVLRGDNPNMFDSGPEILFWILLLLPVLISGFCFYKLFGSKSADEETEF
jgi:hypothetical protein